MKANTLTGLAIAAGIEAGWSDAQIIEHMLSQAKDDPPQMIHALGKEIIHQIKKHHESSLATGQSAD